MKLNTIITKILIMPLCFLIFSWLFLTPCFGQGREKKLGFGIHDTISSDALVISGRYWLSDDTSMDGNFGFRYSDPDKGEDSSFFLLGAGINQYLVTGQSFSPFIGVDFSVEINDPGEGETSNTFKLDGKFGGEYFFTERFSLSSAILLGFRFGDDTEIGTNGILGFFYYLR